MWLGYWKLASLSLRHEEALDKGGALLARGAWIPILGEALVVAYSYGPDAFQTRIEEMIGSTLGQCADSSVPRGGEFRSSFVRPHKRSSG